MLLNLGIRLNWAELLCFVSLINGVLTVQRCWRTSGTFELSTPNIWTFSCRKSEFCQGLRAFSIVSHSSHSLTTRPPLICCAPSSIIVPLSGTGWLWISHLIGRQPPPTTTTMSFPKLLHHDSPAQKGQSREWHLSEATRPLSFLFHPLRLLRQCDIYGGTVNLLRSPSSFWRRNTEGSREKAEGVVKERRWKGWKVEKWGLRIATKQQRKGRIKRGSRVLRSRKDRVINRSRNLQQ